MHSLIPNETLTVELSRSMNEILQTLGVSVLFAGILVGLDIYAKEKEAFESSPTYFGLLHFLLNLCLTWPDVMEQAIWSYYILSQVGADSSHFLICH